MPVTPLRTMPSLRTALFALAFVAARPAAAQQIGARIVSDSAGASAGEVVVQLLAKDGAVLRSRATDPSGFFSWRGLAPGRYQVRVLRIGYLAPDILAAILDGQQPEGLTRTKLIRWADLPIDWDEQRKALGFDVRP